MATSRALRLAVGLAATTASLALAGCLASDAPTAPRRVAAASMAGADDTAAGRRLLECPTSETHTVTELLTPLGGLIQLGGFSVSVPAGALATPQLFSLTVTSGRLMAVDVHAVGLESFVFRRPVTITVDYSRCGDVEGPFRAWHIDPATNRLLENMGGVTDPVRRTHTFQTPHLSVYAMAN